MVDNIIAGFVVLATQFVAVKLVSYLGRQNPWQQRAVLVASAALWVLLNAVAYVLIETRYLPTNTLPIVLLFSSLALLLLLWRQLSSYWSVGVAGADRQVALGIDYKKTLDLVHNEFTFLGTGASKLTALTTEFEEALKRCRPDKPIRFLLLKPTDENLTGAAQRASKDKAEYKTIVLNSLRKIADIYTRRNFDIQVRFYPDAPSGKHQSIPIFRLVFIDDKLCLMSYNILGEGGGPELPQLHLVAAKGDRKASESFYYALERYYESLWDQSDPWDFKEFIPNV